MYKKLKCGRKIISFMLCVFMLLTSVLNVMAAEPDQLTDAVSKANSWLAEVQDGDGKWNADFYTDSMFYTSEISRYFKQENILNDAVRKAEAYLRTLNEERKNNYFAALLAGALEEEYGKEIIGSLLVAQKPDGGWGITDYYESDVPDTIKVLETLIEQNSDISCIKLGIDYLLHKQNSDGSWSVVEGSDGSIALTAEVAILLNQFSTVTGLTSSSLEAAMLKVGGYLESKLGADGTWGTDENSIEDTLLAYRAVLLTVGIGPVSTLEDTIIELQSEKGSWYDDEYITMLAAKALKERRTLPMAEINYIKLNAVGADGEEVESYSYNPYESFDIEVDTKTDNIDSKLFVFIKKPDGTAVSLPSNGTLSWNTANSPEGEYAVEAIIKDNATGRVMARLEKSFTINAGFRTGNVIVSLRPHYTRVDKPVKVNAEISVENFSNIDKRVEVRTAVYSEDKVIEYASKMVLFDSEDAMPISGAILFDPDVSEERDYIIKSSVFDGTKKIAEGQDTFKVLPLADSQTFDYTLMQGEEVSETLNVVIPELPPKADIIFSFDLTGSMGGILNTAKTRAKTIMTELNKLGVDINYGVVSYMDYPYGSYGSGSDYPYKLNCALTESTVSVSNAINSLYLGSGGDGPESYTRVLYESYADENIGWRNGAKKIFVNFGDNVPHDDNLNEGVPGTSGVYNTGMDLGRDGKLGTADDLDLQKVLAEMAANNIELLACQTSGSYSKYWSYWAELTGGKCYDTNSSNMANDVVKAVTTSLTSTDIENLRLIPSVGGEEWIYMTTPDSYSGKTNTVVPFDVFVKVPLGTKKGMYTYNLDAIDSNGVKYATYVFNIDVVTDEVAPAIRTVISTDKWQYLPDKNVDIRALAKNITNIEADFTGKVEIVDSNGKVVDLIKDNINMHWEANETKELNFKWNTGKTVAGRYKVKITWTNEANEFSAYCEFAVSPDGQIKNSVSTDKLSYYANERVNILETVTNTSKNAVVSDLYVQTRIEDSKGQSVWTDETLLVEMLPGNKTRISKNWMAKMAEPGNYKVRSTVYETVYGEVYDNAVICSSVTPFEILPSDGTRLGLIGKIEAAPKIIAPDGTVVFSRTLSNTGNIDIDTIKREVVIKYPVTGAIVDTITDTVSLPLSKTISDSITWNKGRLKDGDYLVIYQVELTDGTVIVLGSTGFKVKGNATPTPSRTPTPSTVVMPTEPIPVANPADLAISIFADKTLYMENEEIIFTVKYRNVLETGTGAFKITAQIPEGTTIVDAGEGKVTGNTITWEIPGFLGKSSAQKVYRVKIGELGKSERLIENTAKITGASGLINTEDDTSTIKVMARTAKHGNIMHKAYIKGYPGEVFIAENDLTRAEAATIFAKIMDLDSSVAAKNTYSDVDTTHWAWSYIEAVTEAGIFRGYGDGTFRPEDKISRAEFATTIAQYFKLGNVAPFEENYSDIKGHWAQNYIEEIMRYKLIEGYEDGSFRPQLNIKRSEAVTMINKMLFRGPLIVETPTFKDIKTSDWFFGQVEEAARDHEVTIDEGNNEVMVTK